LVAEPLVGEMIEANAAGRYFDAGEAFGAQVIATTSSAVMARIAGRCITALTAHRSAYNETWRQRE